MDALDCIFTRRSIRKYKSDAVNKEHIELMIKAGMHAPTARNTQSNQFIIVDEKPKLDGIALIHPHAQMLKKAPLCIVICGDKSFDNEENYLVVNGSAATQNVLLAAHALGIGACWLGIYGRPERMEGLTKLLNLPEHIIPISAIALGYPDETKGTPERFQPEKLHFNSWD